jgi:bifunctional DNA-binding transcriptional regulator/antitoxin component of YhaV-PrlF toxin-antitoxin module
MATYNGRVSSEGTVTIPEPLKDKLEIQSGDAVRFHIENQSLVIEKAFPSIESVFGIIPTPAHLVGRDINEMIDEAMADHADEVVRRMRLGLE